jgi:hypothetical protein
MLEANFESNILYQGNHDTFILHNNSLIIAIIRNMDLKKYFSCPGFPYRQIGKTKQNKYEVNKDIT